MAVETHEDAPETEVEETEVEETEVENDDEEDSGESDAKKNPDLEKAIKARDRAKAEARRYKAELEKATKKDDTPDPVATANRRLVTSSARAVLAAQGVTDRDDQKAVIGILNLSDIDVDDEDGPDEDAIEERIEDLRRIFGGQKVPARRLPGSVKAKDPSKGKGDTTDPDKARYTRILSGR